MCQCTSTSPLAEQKQLARLQSLQHGCGHAGLVDSAEMGELIYLVERQKKRLHFGAPTLRVPPLSKELWQHPLLKGLTAQERAQVRSHHLTPLHVVLCNPTKTLDHNLWRHNSLLCMPCIITHVHSESAPSSPSGHRKADGDIQVLRTVTAAG